MADETRSGLFLEGQCANTRCKARAVVHMGYRNLSFLSDEFDCKCPLCDKGLKPTQFLFRKCMYKIEYRQHVKFGKPPQTRVAVDWKSVVTQETFNLETCGLRNLLDLKIECIPEVSIKNLTLLKWVDSNGREQKFYLHQKVSSKWRDFGHCFDLEENELDAIEEECFRRCDRCWYKVMDQWLNGGGTAEYPITWKGVIKVLEDVRCDTVAKQLKRVLFSTNISTALVSTPRRHCSSSCCFNFNFVCSRFSFSVQFSTPPQEGT